VEPEPRVLQGLLLDEATDWRLLLGLLLTNSLACVWFRAVWIRPIKGLVFSFLLVGISTFERAFKLRIELHVSDIKNIVRQRLTAHISEKE
jgi:hypothetical protein